MKNLYIEIQGNHHSISEVFRSIVGAISQEANVEILNDALDNDSSEYMLLKISDVQDSHNKVLLNKTDISELNINIIPEIEPDIEYDSEIQLEYYKKVGVVDTSMVYHADSNVILTHMKSGITIKCQAYRSKHKNKEEAIKFLHSKLLKENYLF